MQTAINRPFQTRPRRTGLRAAVVALSLALGGCATVSSGSPDTGNYWLIKVRDGYGNIYGYPTGDRPSAAVQAAYVGRTTAAAHSNATAAAKRLGIAHLDSGIY